MCWGARGRRDRCVSVCRDWKAVGAWGADAGPPGGVWGPLLPRVWELTSEGGPCPRLASLGVEAIAPR